MSQCASDTPIAMPLSFDLAELLKLSLESGGLTLRLGPILLIIIFLLVIFFSIHFFRRWKWVLATWSPVEAELEIANLGKVKIKPNTDTVRIAYQAWVEINTRKVGLRFDEENDVIVEVYNSWYQLFGILRDLTKQIPAHKLRDCEDTRKLVHIMHTVLNEGLRPHLTRWQARFRHEYDLLRKNQPNTPPQELQRQIIGYSDLIQDLKNVNEQFVKYGDWLRRIADGQPSS
ncbi:hypothetical protein EPN96_11125 [bacterium]|nr:MAG: hypothetical protein EPN96_11125 [bacterium]